MHTLTVVVPVYNEAATLRSAVERLLKTPMPISTEVVVVDDGSTDGSVETIADLAEDRLVRLIRHDRNRGKGAAVRTGIAEANGSLLTVMDADLEYDPEDYHDLLMPIVNGEARVVYGTRQFGSHTAFSFWYVLGNKLVSFWASFLYNGWLSDVETCFKVAETSVWRALGLRSTGFGIEAETTGKLLKSGHRIHEVPIRYQARSREEGKKLTAHDGLEALWILLRIRLFGRVATQSS